MSQDETKHVAACSISASALVRERVDALSWRSICMVPALPQPCITTLSSIHQFRAMIAAGLSSPAPHRDETSTRKCKRPRTRLNNKCLSRRRNHVTFNSGVITYHVAQVCTENGQAETGLVVDHTAVMLKAADGPRPESIFLNDLILAFFERGQINGPDDLRLHLTVVPVLLHRQVEARLRRVVETIADAVDGHAVGLLPSNVRLSNEHLTHLTELLGWMAEIHQLKVDE